MASREKISEKRRQDILTASLELFVEKGYAGTTVRDISAATRTSNGLLFHYFKTKQAIIAELANHAMEGVASVAQLLASGLPPAEIFRSITQTILTAYRSPHGRYLFLLVNQIKTQSSIPPKVKKKVASIDTIALSARVIRTGQESGVFKGGNAIALALTYWGAIQGIGEALGWYRDAPMPDVKNVLDILKKKDGSSEH